MSSLDKFAFDQKLNYYYSFSYWSEKRETA